MYLIHGLHCRDLVGIISQKQLISLILLGFPLPVLTGENGFGSFNHTRKLSAKIQHALIRKPTSALLWKHHISTPSKYKMIVMENFGNDMKP